MFRSSVFHGMFKSYIGLIILLLLISTFIALAMSMSVRATSLKDDWYHTSDMYVDGYISSGSRVSTSRINVSQTFREYLTNEDNYASNVYGSPKQSFLNALDHGRWGVSQKTAKLNVNTDAISYVTVYWTEDDSLSLDWSGYPYPDAILATGNSIKYARITFNSESSTEPKMTNWGAATQPDLFVSTKRQYSDTTYCGFQGLQCVSNLFVHTDDSNNPVGYAGPPIGDGSADSDGDGLSLNQEVIQGTIDAIGRKDTDSDGLDDYLESKWSYNRVDTFCRTNVTPHVCAYPDPIKKDLYVEIDWLDDGVKEYKPSLSQVELVKSKFSDLDVIFHSDMGEYGGGNELVLASFEQTVDPQDDYYGHKWGYQTINQGNFSENRYKVWHYMISGYNFNDGTPGSTESSGVAEVGGDDSFLSYGLLAKTRTGSVLDNAIAGTIVHELGHNLCLSKTSYTGQDPSCLYSGIDNDSSSLFYLSSMNYAYQYTNNYSYSNGDNILLGDHDDREGITIGFNDFQNDNDSSVGGP